MTFSAGTVVHIVGIGGAGMSGVARLLVERGCVVSGSDNVASPVTQSLLDAGVTFTAGYDLDGARRADVVLWSPAVAASHPELLAAGEGGALLLERARVLEVLSKIYEVVGITGTHGKTTATSMLAHVFAAASLDPGRLIGAEVRGVGPNGHAGTTGQLLLETDESYGTFAYLEPQALGLLNVEVDHLDFYQSLTALESAFVALAQRVRGPLVIWTDDPGAQRVADALDRAVVRVGTIGDVRWCVEDVVVHRRGASFVLRGPQTLNLQLSVTGKHNVANAAVVAVVAVELGLSPTAVAKGLATFAGAPRRFEFRGRWRSMDVYEDYAHLPGEIAATVRAARDAGYERVACVFQPHRISRTLAIGDGFASAFDEADEVIVTDIYTAGEPNPQGIDGRRVFDPLHARRGDVVRYAPSRSDVGVALDAIDADVLFVLGAGDIAAVIDALDLDND
jgi:UDP-N-acetylmuramate--alanine ligase